MKNLLLCILFLSFYGVKIFSDEISDPFATTSLASTEGLPNSVISGHVSVISGDFLIHEVDMVLPGIKPLVLQRSYCSSDNYCVAFTGSWHFSEPTPIFYTYNGLHKALITTPHGARAAFENTQKKNTEEMSFCLSVKKGYTNCGGGKLSGQTNISNIEMLVKKIKKAPNYNAELKFGSGITQFYSLTEIMAQGRQTFILNKEVSPDRTRKYFKYDDLSSLLPTEIKLVNQNKDLCYGKFNFKGAKDGIDVFSSTDKLVKYNFPRKIKPLDHFYLEKVINPERPTVSYSYKESERFDNHRIINEISYPDRRGLKIIYYDKKSTDRKDIKDRVRELQEPVGPNGSYVTTYKFSYEIAKKDGKLSNGTTKVSDAYGRKTIYDYDKDERLVNVSRQDMLKEAYAYENDGNLTGCFILDRTNNNIKNTIFKYDARGNVIETTLSGNVTGIYGSYKKSFYFGSGNFVLADREDNGKGVCYSYEPGTNAIKSKLLVNGDNQILLREFSDHNENLFVIKKIIDDGSTGDSNDLKDVTYRKITYNISRSTAPFGLVQESIEKYLDLESGEEKQLRRVVNHHSIEGWLTHQDIFDANNVYQYTLSTVYDAHGNVVKQIDELGEETLRKYDANDNMICEEKPSRGVKTLYSYDLVNRLTAIEERHSDGQIFITKHTYDLVGNKTSTTDPQGHVTHYTYDNFNRLKSITHPQIEYYGGLVHPVEVFDYDLLGYETYHKDKEGFETRKRNNINGDPLEIVYPDGTQERFEYYPNGALYKTIAKNGTYTIYTRDCLNQVLKEEMFDNAGTSLCRIVRIYKGTQLISEENSEGLITSYKYDGASRLIEKKIGSSKETYTYDSMGRIAEEIHWISEGEALVQAFTYDAIGQVLSETTKDLEGNQFTKVDYEYDVFGQKTKIIKENSIEKYLYNSRQELVKSIDAEGNVTEYSYDDRFTYGPSLVGKKTTTTDPLGQQTIVIQDVLGRAIETTKVLREKLLAQMKCFYNLENDLIKVEEAKVVDGVIADIVVREWTYNSMHEVLTLREAPETADERVRTYTYNSFGQKNSLTKPDGVIIHYFYDAKGRLSEFNSSDQTISYRYTYNSLDQITDVYDLIQNQKTSRRYDLEGRLIQETLGNGLTLRYAYDALDRRTQMTLPDDSEVTYSYNAAQLKTVTRGSYTHQFDSYDALGNLEKSTLPKNAGQLNYTYDQLPRKRSIRHSNFFHEIPNDGFDAVGNLLKDAISHGNDKLERTFDYDSLYQLTQESGSEEHYYTYDSLNNRLSKDDSACKTSPLNYLLEQESVTYLYDKNGNRIEKNDHGVITCYTYDALNRMTSAITENGIYYYIYDPFDRRLAKKSDTIETYLYDGQNEVGMYANGALKELRILSHPEASEHGTAIVLQLNEELLIPIHDLNGNVSLLVKEDGSLAKTYHYTAFGIEVDPSDADLNPWRYASKRFDPETGFIYFGRRYYDPHTAQWTSPDPAEYEDGPNLHAYLLNNPLNRFDAYGLWGEDWESGLDYGYGRYNSYDMGVSFLGSRDYQNNWLYDGFGNEDFSYTSNFSSTCVAQSKSMLDYCEDGGNLALNLFFGGIRDACNMPENASLLSKTVTYAEAGFDMASCVTGLKFAAVGAKVTYKSVKNLALKVAVKNIESKIVAAELKYTKSNLKLGQEMHKAYKAFLHNGETLLKEFKLKSGRKIDFLDLEKGIIYELKPFNPRAIKQGRKQLEIYKREIETMDRFRGRSFQTVLETY